MCVCMCICAKEHTCIHACTYTCQRSCQKRVAMLAFFTIFGPQTHIDIHMYAYKYVCKRPGKGRDVGVLLPHLWPKMYSCAHMYAYKYVCNSVRLPHKSRVAMLAYLYLGFGQKQTYIQTLMRINTYENTCAGRFSYASFFFKLKIYFRKTLLRTNMCVNVYLRG